MSPCLVLKGNLPHDIPMLSHIPVRPENRISRLIYMCRVATGTVKFQYPDIFSGPQVLPGSHPHIKPAIINPGHGMK